MYFCQLNILNPVRARGRARVQLAKDGDHRVHQLTWQKTGITMFIN